MEKPNLFSPPISPPAKENNADNHHAEAEDVLAPTWPMKPWLRFLLLVNTIGGGSIGLAVASTTWAGMKPQFANVMLVGVFAALFSAGIYAGWLLSTSATSGLRWVRAYLALQIPLISSPLFGYQLISAAGFNISIGLLGAGLSSQLTFTYAEFFGSVVWLSLGQGAPFRVGVNLIPVLLLVLVNRSVRSLRAPPATA